MDAMETSFSTLTFFDDTPYNLTGRWFRQITPLVIRNTRSLGTNDILKTLRTFLEPSAQYHRQTHRTVRVVFGVSLNAQSQTPDIPGIPLCAVSSRYEASLQTQALAPDIPLVSLYAYMEELSSSFNVQDQSPDDSYDQDRRCSPCIPRKGSHVHPG